MPVEPFVDIREVAEFLGKERAWIYDNQARLGIPRCRIGKHYRYRLTEVARWMEQNRVAGS
ncbi:helix-turn-helix domain-containing protein [Nocardioides sp. GY 10127]|uniref:helix-turn-helix domain-containing protein n=1 Tax=Nocardioides sp. GY 10127 TaxID=2569762 RepID=UPI0010A94C6C|nr:helix-turn-helix domain-containing protein [Nocardioides sp. GY 10127]TIC80705.1 helix-turn-helix domain-containing protein [Nocardioides sp. GY 10127]